MVHIVPRTQAGFQADRHMTDVAGLVRPCPSALLPLLSQLAFPPVHSVSGFQVGRAVDSGLVSYTSLKGKGMGRPECSEGSVEVCARYQTGWLSLLLTGHAKTLKGEGVGDIPLTFEWPRKASP